MEGGSQQENKLVNDGDTVEDRIQESPIPQGSGSEMNEDVSSDAHESEARKGDFVDTRTFGKHASVSYNGSGNNSSTVNIESDGDASDKINSGEIYDLRPPPSFFTRSHLPDFEVDSFASGVSGLTFTNKITRDDAMSSSSSITEFSTKSSPDASRKKTPSKKKGVRSVPLKSSPPSLLSRGLSLFSRTPTKQAQPYSNYGSRLCKDDNDADSVGSGMSRGVRSLAFLRSTDNEELLKRNLEESGLMLVKRLIEFLSDCPPAPGEDGVNSGAIVSGRIRFDEKTVNRPKSKKRGLTLPASAVGWISLQAERLNSENVGALSRDVLGGVNHCYEVPIHQLECLLSLLRRVISLRISREVWPPPLSSSAVGASEGGTPKASFATIPERRAVSSMKTSQSTDESEGVDAYDEESYMTATSQAMRQNETQITVSKYQRYFHELQHKPDVNMSLFPNATKLVIDGIPPNWISNLDSLKNLDMFQMEKGCLLDINRLFFPSDFVNDKNYESVINPDQSRNILSGNDGNKLNQEQCYPVYSMLTKLRLTNCAIGEISGLRGVIIPNSNARAEPYATNENPSRPRRMPVFSRFPNLISLNLSHNEISKTKSAFAGLSSLPFLSSINLSYNRLKSMDKVFLYIGNVKELILSGNEISSTHGLDRLYSLERLSLDENKIEHLSSIAGIAKLPFLMNFDLKGNPLESDDPASCRIKVLNLFREIRCSSLPKNATYRDMQQLLPILDNEIAVKEELVALKNLTFRQTVTTTEAFLAPLNPSDHSASAVKNDAGELPEDVAGEISSSDEADFKLITVTTTNQNQGIRRTTHCCPPRTVHFRLAGSSILRDLTVRRTDRFYRAVERRIEKSFKADKKNRFGKQVPAQFELRDIVASMRPNVNSRAGSVASEADESTSNSILKEGSFSSQHSQGKSNDDNADSASDAPFPYRIPLSILEEASDDVWNPPDYFDVDSLTDVFLEAEKNSGDIQHDFNDKHEDGDVAGPAKSDDGDIDNESDPIGPDSASSNGQTINDDLEALSRFKENEVTLSPEDDFTKSEPMENPFSDTCAPEPPEAVINGNEPLDGAGNGVSDLESKKSMFDSIWEQAYRDNMANGSNVSPEPTDLNENGASRLLDFNTAEVNASYDGPPDYSSLFVSSDLDLYYDAFVFPQDAEENNLEDVNPADRVMAPRIQLFKFDRDLLIETKKLSGAGLPSSIDLHERYVGIWKEDVLACGSCARSRLPPVKIPKRGFHGETISRAGKELTVSESRKFILCLSDSAIYFIVDDDVSLSLTNNQQSKQTGETRVFPSRIPADASFKAAYWPHAVSRHSLDCLCGITIGFQFQRLILRFSVPYPKGRTNADGVPLPSLEYVYVLLTSNKLQTISLLQKLQLHLADVNSGASGNETCGAVIDNDDKSFLDALGARVDEVVLHYQILRQVWKRGDREAARRAFVLTDSTVYLLNETYYQDGTVEEDDNENNQPLRELGDISLAIIDSAGLSRVTEVRAANADPRMITLVILPANKFKRSHRWRLVCKDGEAAERLIDDVRKALGAIS